MIAGSAAEARVSAELWTSFLGLLRAYAAVASLEGVPYMLTDRGDGFVAVQAGTERLSLLFSPSRATIACVIGGACNCAYYSEEFTFLEDGRLASSTAIRELDDVVIELIGKLRKKSERPQ